MDNRELDEKAMRMYGRTYRQLKAAGYIWALCVEKVESAVQSGAEGKKEGSK